MKISGDVLSDIPRNRFSKILIKEQINKMNLFLLICMIPIGIALIVAGGKIVGGLILAYCVLAIVVYLIRGAHNG
jgi:hypothetical protein